MEWVNFSSVHVYLRWVLALHFGTPDSARHGSDGEVEQHVVINLDELQEAL